MKISNASYLFFVFTIWLFFQSQIAFSQFHLPNRLKQKTTTSFTFNPLDTVMVMRETYNPQGKLLLREQPQYYCTEQYKYDTLNRLIEEDIMCGESNGNGITTILYSTSNKIIYKGDFGAYPFYLQIDSLDDKKRCVLTKKWRSSIHDDSLYTEIHTLYSQTNKPISIKEHTQNYHKEQNIWLPDTETKTEKLYSYSPTDSLLKIVFTDTQNKESKILEENFYDAKNRLTKTIYHYDTGKSQKLFFYDSDNRLINVRMETQAISKNVKKNKNANWLIENNTLFIYAKNKINTKKQDDLIQEIITSYWQGSIRTKITNYYQNGLITHSIETDFKGKITEKLFFTYQFFE
jgi:hypothetical protein